jgi:hypothetical protein
MSRISRIGGACLAGALVFNPFAHGAESAPGKKVKVFILLGQSNMVGMGNVTGDKDGTLEYATKTEKLYPYLLDAVPAAGPSATMCAMCRSWSARAAG